MILKAYRVVEKPTWTLGCDCAIVFAENREEAIKITGYSKDPDNDIVMLKEIPIEKGYYYIGGHIE